MDFKARTLSQLGDLICGNFDVDKFTHYANYRPVDGSARSFLISRERQTVSIEALGTSFEFDKWEPMFMEISQKYTDKMIADLADASGFEIRQNFVDSRNYYCDSLWQTVSVART